jgi:hypothetical protein
MQSVSVGGVGLILLPKPRIYYQLYDFSLTVTATAVYRIILFFGAAYNTVDSKGYGGMFATFASLNGNILLITPYRLMQEKPELFRSDLGEGVGIYASGAVTFVAGSFIRFNEVSV